MKIEDIREPNVYHYKRTIWGREVTGKIVVAEVYQRARRYWIVGLDKVLGRTITLQPGQIVKPVRIKK